MKDTIKEKNEFHHSKKDNINELIRNLGISITSLIPVGGGVLSFFLDKYLPNTIEKRKNEFLNKLAKDMENLPEDVVKKIYESKEFTSIVLKVFKSVIYEEQEIKINAFRNIIMNTALSLDNETNEKEFYIKLIMELTTDQIKILQLFYLRDSKNVIRFTSIYKYISKMWKNVDESYRFALVTELIRYGLITSSNKMQRNKGEGEHLSKFGKRFIYFIFQPNETNIDTDSKKIGEFIA